MTERDWEATARARLERTIEDLVSRMRDAADRIEREAEHNLASASKATRTLEFHTYSRVAGEALHELHGLIPNINFANIIDAAAEAEAARQEQKTASALLPKAAKNVALQAVLGALGGWIEGARANHDALGHSREDVGEECWRRYAPADIRRMVNDAARDVGISEFPEPADPPEDQAQVA